MIILDFKANSNTVHLHDLDSKLERLSENDWEWKFHIVIPQPWDNSP